MRKYVPLFLALFVCLQHSLAATNITTSTVSGRWTASGSPYLIYNDIIISDTLTIDAGVNVILQGNYTITVPGIIKLNGSPSNYITFSRNDTTGWSDTDRTRGGWLGIYIMSCSPIDTFSISYCNFNDIKYGRFSLYGLKKNVKNCNFYHNYNCLLNIQSCNQDSLLEFSNCTIHDNISKMPWAADIANFSYGNFRLTNNSAYNNYFSGHLFYLLFANFHLDGNKIYANCQTDTTSGSIIGLYEATANIKNNMVYKNTTTVEGAISEWESFVDIDGNYICNNKVLLGNTGGGCGALQGGGGIRLHNTYDTLERVNLIRNNIIANNRTEFLGAAVYVFGANVKIYNNTIANNYDADLAGGSIYLINSSATGGHLVSIKNNLFHNNKVSDGVNPDKLQNIALGWADTLEVANNCFQRSISAEFPYASTSVNHWGDTLHNVISTSMEMVSPTLTYADTESALFADFSLLATSICINGGDSANCVASTSDYGNKPRYSGSAVDIGAYEYQQSAFVSNSTNGENTFSLYPNPNNGVFTIRQTLTDMGAITIVIRDLLGNEIVRKMIKFSNGIAQLEIPESSAGLYLAEIREGTIGVSNYKIIVK